MKEYDDLRLIKERKWGKRSHRSLIFIDFIDRLNYQLGSYRWDVVSIEFCEEVNCISYSILKTKASNKYTQVEKTYRG